MTDRKIVMRCYSSCSPEPSDSWKISEDKRSIKIKGLGNVWEEIVMDSIITADEDHSSFFDEALSEWVSETLDGRNLTVLTYGLPRSGKTYTVFGSPGMHSRGKPSQKGIVAQCFDHLIANFQQRSNTFAEIKASFFHISPNGQIADLIDGKKRNLKIKQTDNGKYSIPDSTQKSISSSQHLMNMLKKSLLMRNATGSIKRPTGGDHWDPKEDYRPHLSHAIFQYTIEQCNETSMHVINSALTIVDLAGHDIACYHQNETTADVGISALHDTLVALKNEGVLKASPHCLSSSLTKLLYNGLFGNSRIIIVNTLQMEPKTSLLINKTLKTAAGFKFCSNHSHTNLTSLSSSSLGGKLNEIDYQKGIILQELKMNDKNLSGIEIVSDSTLNINGKMYYELTPKCEQAIKDIKEIEKHILSTKSIAGPGVSKPVLPSLLFNEQKPKPLLAHIPHKPKSISPLKMPESEISASQTKQTLKKHSSSEESSSESEICDTNTNKEPLPPLKDIPHILPPLTSSQPSQIHRQILPALPPIKKSITQLPLFNNDKRNIVTNRKSSPSSSSSSYSPPPPPSITEEKKKRQRKRVVKRSPAQQVKQQLMHHSLRPTRGTTHSSSDSSNSSEEEDNFDPNFTPRVLPLNRRLSSPMQPFNNNLQPIQNFTVSRSNSFPPLPNYQEPALSNHESQNTQVPIPPDTQYLSNQEIHLSAMNGDKSSYMKKLVMKYGVDHSDHGGRTPLMYSVLGNQPKMTECLINMGAEIDAIDVSHHTALLWAVYHAKSEVVKVLLKHGANIQITDAQKRSVFHWAMKTPNVTCLKHLCKCTATFDMENKADTEGLTPLHWAVLCEQPQHIYTLLSSLPSAQISLPDPKDRTPLNYAVLNFSLSCIKAILDCCPMACNFKDTQGRTALHYACAENSDCVRTLLACKSCDIHAVDDLGTTPLHWAAASNQPSNLKLLLRRGADCDHKDNQDMTPLDHAFKRNHTECINLLEKLRLERSTSTWSITSQISIHPPNAPELDQFGHVPMRRPPSVHGHGLLSDDSSPLLANNDRLPADGNSNTEELEQQEVVVTNNNSNQSASHVENVNTATNSRDVQSHNLSWKYRLAKIFCSCTYRNNVIVPEENNNSR